MTMRTLLAALVGLAFLAPAGSAAIAAPRDGASAFLLAQANQKEAETTNEEADDKRRKSRPSREDARDKGSARGESDRRAKQDAQKAERESRAKAAAEQKEQREAAQRAEREARAKAAAEEKEKREAAQKAERDARAKAAAEEKEKREAAQKAKRDAEAKDAAERRDARRPAQQTQEPAQRTQEPAQRTQETDRRQQTRERSRERRRDAEEERQARERAQRREQQRTSAQELSKVQVRAGDRRAIDGGRRSIEREGNRVVIRTDDTSRLATRGKQRGNERTERLPNGHTRTIVIYPDGSQIITVTDARGRIIHRSRRERGGREIVYFREINRPPLVQIDLGPIRIGIPREHYIVDSRRASRADMRRVFWAPPVEPIRQIYTIDEVRRFDRVRNIMPRLDFHTITFDTDSAMISPQQVDLLADIADLIHELIDENPAEVILIEGYTDAPGSEVYNLALSERRAEAIAIALTDYFDVPPENLVTQGFGEAFLKIPTEAAERENRRVAFRRVTPLVSEYGR